MNFFSLFKRKLLYQLKKKINIDQETLNQKTLDKLFHHYGSDKANEFRIKNSKGHGFADFYTKEFNHLKQQNIKILEIGSYAGASAAAFSKYFLNSNVYCFDINISNFIYYSKNIHVFGVDIKNEKKINKLLNEISIKSNSNFFDIIIDDGSHNLSDILFNIKKFFSFLNKGGIYVIEDYKHPNYYNYNRDIKHILVDEFLQNLIKKKFFLSNIFAEEDQIYLHKNIREIKIYRGNLEDSDISFIKKI